MVISLTRRMSRFEGGGKSMSRTSCVSEACAWDQSELVSVLRLSLLP